MGIHGLMKLINEEAPGAIKEQELENLTGRKIAIDASMALYQFLVAVRSNGPGGGNASAMLTNEAGEVTSHIQGMFNRTIKMMSSGIKPCYIFDGKPPQMKGGELAKRIAKRAKAETELAAAKESGDQDDIDKFSRRLVKVTRQHNEDCKELLRLMGVPYVNSPCEAEAQCAELAKKGKVYATATEDMDALTFRTPKLLRRLTFSQGKDKQAILEIDVELVLKGLELSYDQFVDLCILCGCDYCTTIKGVGPKTALKLIKTYKTIEGVILFLKKDKKYVIPDDWKMQKVSRIELEALEKADKEAEEKKKIDAEKFGKHETGVVGADSSTSSSSCCSSSKSNENNEKGGNNTEIVESSTSLETELVTDNIDVGDIGDVSFASIEEENIIEEEDVSIFDMIVPESINTVANADDDDDVVVHGTAENEDDFVIIQPLFDQARGLFVRADVTPAADVELKWTEPDVSGLTSFLVDRMGFNADRVSNSIKRLQEAQKNKSQKRMDSFFTVLPSANAGIKRKVEDAKNKGKVGKDIKKPAFAKKR